MTTLSSAKRHKMAWQVPPLSSEVHSSYRSSPPLVETRSSQYLNAIVTFIISELFLRRAMGTNVMRGASISPLGRMVTVRPKVLATKATQRCRPSVHRREYTRETATATLSPRWLSDVKQRIGKCILFGLKPHQTDHAGRILQEIAKDWRELVAGSEGFLTSKNRTGLFRQEVVWGEMDSMV